MVKLLIFIVGLKKIFTSLMLWHVVDIQSALNTDKNKILELITDCIKKEKDLIKDHYLLLLINVTI